MSESSVVMVLLHGVFGRPLLRFPVGVHLRATFGIESCGIRRTWPNHTLATLYPYTNRKPRANKCVKNNNNDNNNNNNIYLKSNIQCI